MAVGEVLKKRPFKVALKVIISLPPCSLRDDKNIEMAYSKAFKTDLGPTCCACCSCCCNCCGGRGIADLGCMQTDCTASCLQGCANCCPTRIPQLTNFGVSQFSFEKPYRQTWYNVLQYTKGNIQ